MYICLLFHFTCDNDEEIRDFEICYITAHYVQVPYPTAIVCQILSTKMKEVLLVKKAVLPHTETKKPAHPFIFN